MSTMLESFTSLARLAGQLVDRKVLVDTCPTHLTRRDIFFGADESQIPSELPLLARPP